MGVAGILESEDTSELVLSEISELDKLQLWWLSLVVCKCYDIPVTPY